LYKQKEYEKYLKNRKIMDLMKLQHSLGEKKAKIEKEIKEKSEKEKLLKRKLNEEKKEYYNRLLKEIAESQLQKDKKVNILLAELLDWGNKKSLFCF
jgi:hypothetical protein